MKKVVKALLVVFSLIIILFYIGPFITTGDHSIGVLLGLGFALLLLLYVVFFDKINAIIKSIWKNKIGKAVSILLICVVVITVTVGGYSFSKVFHYSKTDSTQTEYAILLGCKVNGDRPGVFLRQRINAAYRFLNENPNAKIILSGGQGNNEDISEAQCMYNELLDKGVSADRMIIEEKSTSTEENFKFSKEIMEEKGIDCSELTVVTNDFHEYRASQFAKQQGITAHPYPCKTPWNGYMPFATREAIAVILQIFLGLHR